MIASECRTVRKAARMHESRVIEPLTQRSGRESSLDRPMTCPVVIYTKESVRATPPGSHSLSLVLRYRVIFSAPARAIIGCRRGIRRPPSQPLTASKRSLWKKKKKRGLRRSRAAPVGWCRQAERCSRCERGRPQWAAQMMRLRGGDAASGDAGDRAREQRPWPWSWRGPS